MVQDTITFCCPACGIKLTVPASLAGIVGPCPACQRQIQAPIPQRPQPAASPAPTSWQGPGHPHAGVPQGMPQIVAPAAAPAPQASGYPPPQGQPPAAVPQPMPAATAEPQAANRPAPVRPAPRQLPQREPVEIAARQMPEPRAHHRSSQHHPAPLPRHPYQQRRLLRLLMLLAFLVASGALVYGVLTLLKLPPKQETSENPAKLQRDAAERQTDQPDGESQQGNSPPATALPTPQPDLAQLSPTAPEELPAEPESPWGKSEEVLEKFLTASSLEERLPLIETRMPSEELSATCLAGRLPPASKMMPEFRESNPLESLVDCYYTVEFAGDTVDPPLHTVLVRSRGGEAKVVVDPFLDSFGGRLAAYASTPSDKAGVFQVVVYAVANCTDPKIPNREKKLTLKLLAADNTKEIARAYFGRQSKISEMLEDGSYSLSYGNAKACTVMLRWNTEEDAAQPFLEAIAIKSLDWNS